MTNIGLYCGTFNPFHKGHLNIFHKAKKLFDKVVVCRGKNPDKHMIKADFQDWEIPGVVHTHMYDGLTTELIKWFEQGGQNTVTLIRGIRNGNDYDYEMNQIEVMRDLYPELNVILIPCDREFAHISSSMIRSLQGLSCYDEARKYLP